MQRFAILRLPSALGAITLAGALFATAALVAPTALAAGPSSPQTGAAKAVSMNGGVTVTRKADAQKKALSPGDLLAPGDLIETQATGSARILLEDQSIIDLGPSTQFRVEGIDDAAASEDRQVDLAVDFGRVRASVNRRLQKKGKFEIRTRSSVLSVRGTEFVVTTDQLAGASSGFVRDRTTVTVLDGKVEVATPSGAPKPTSTLLLAGTQLSAIAEVPEAKSEAGLPAVPPARAGLTRAQKLQAPRLRIIQAQSRVVDHTFTQAVVVGDRSSSRFRGASTLRVVAGNATIPKLTVPRASFTVPGTFIPSAQLLTGSLYGIYNVNLQVKFGP